jgi:hypothetical protein
VSEVAIYIQIFWGQARRLQLICSGF